ncbi:hypothetical protein LJC18_02200 [Lachnospiraceae bacterium OttesenSCG-928-E19]|nr:hypothetical protein [Lachnospiraceae bacterium OttesenSCG-928-E19]
MKSIYKYLIGFCVVAILTICCVCIMLNKNSTNRIITFGAEPVYGLVHMIWDSHFDIDTISQFTDTVPELVTLKDKSIYDSIYTKTINGRPDLVGIADRLSTLIEMRDGRVKSAYDAYSKFWDDNADVLNKYLNDTEQVYKQTPTKLNDLENNLAIFFDTPLIKYANYFVPFVGNGSGGVSIGDGAIVGINVSREHTYEDVLFYISVVFHEWNHAMFTKSELFSKYSQKMDPKEFLLFQEVLATAYQALVLEAIGGDINQPLYDNAEYDRLARKFIPVLKASFEQGVKLNDAWIVEYWQPIVETYLEN